MICRQIYGEVKYLCDDERKKRADEEGVSENEVDQEECPEGYADLEAKALFTDQLDSESEIDPSGQSGLRHRQRHFKKIQSDE